MSSSQLFFRVFLISLALIMSGFTTVCAENRKAKDGMEQKSMKRVILIGASVGRAWNFPDLPARLGRDDYVFEYIGEYEFDKTPALMKLFNRRQDRPDAIIIKECAAYFPRNSDQYKQLIIQQVKDCLVNKIVPILATTVPVITPPFGTKFYFKDLLKTVWPNKIRIRQRLEPILRYNDWIIEYSTEQGLPVLDLEGALRVTTDDRRLRIEYTSGDGLHLNQDAYKVLDGIIMPVLDSVLWTE